MEGRTTASTIASQARHRDTGRSVQSNEYPVFINSTICLASRTNRHRCRYILPDLCFPIVSATLFQKAKSLAFAYTYSCLESVRSVGNALHGKRIQYSSRPIVGFSNPSARNSGGNHWCICKAWKKFRVWLGCTCAKITDKYRKLTTEHPVAGYAFGDPDPVRYKERIE
jgi:hypothetical protein